MSNAYTNNQTAGEPGYLPGPEAGCQANDLKGLLNAIVTQISEADRRHSDSLQQMQDRLSNLGRDARSMRSRVPDQFQTAFERIETGMAELAARIAEAQHAETPEEFFAPRAQTFAADLHEAPAAPPAAPASYAQEPAAHADEEPMALRSAQSAQASALPSRAAKPVQAFDTFDVIESLPGDVSDPWDRDAANALASVYDAEPRTFAQDPYGTQIADAPRVYAAVSAPAAAAAAPGVDQGWLEKRFTEISARIEESLADIRPDQSFFALGQRIDQFERSFAQAFDNVATKNDVESIRLIEAHMVELVGHLENTQNQMARIDTIEEQLAAIAQRLGEVHDIAASASDTAPAAAAPHVDVAAVARAAAHEAASEAAARFVAQPQAPAHLPGIDDMRRLMEQSISNARQSEENTTALLDTLQQAMIRLLDRMDAIEINQHQAAAVHMTAVPETRHVESFDPPEYAHPAKMAEPQLPYPAREMTHDALDEAVAAVASKSTQHAPSRPAAAAPASEAAEPPRRELRAAPQAPAAASAPPSEKLRQDFIADARRAKMRLANDEEAIVLPAPGKRDAAAPAGGKPASAAKTKAAAETPATAYKGKSFGEVSPRVVALTVALALAGVAYVMIPHGKRAPSASAPVAATEQSAPAPSEAETRTTQNAPSNNAPAASNEGSDAPPPEADFSKSPSSKSGKDAPTQLNIIEGQIVPGDMTTGSAARPLHGISVASGEKPTPELLSKMQRDQAMANVSSRLGEAAAPTTPVAPSRISLDANNPDNQQQGVMPPRSESSALDMPPATVGPLSLRLAAANGDPSAQFEVGARLAEGKGTDQSFKDAAKWYQRSASQGFAQAQYRLGTLYERGLGLKSDEARAKEWYLRAAEQGNMKAMHNLAVLSANSKSGSPDYATASKWFQDAAERGLADSQFNLAVLYENGLGVEADMRQAYKWLSLAARGGDKEATRRRDIMKGKLQASDLAEADGMIRMFHIRQSDQMVNDARTAGEAWKRNPANGENG